MNTYLAYPTYYALSNCQSPSDYIKPIWDTYTLTS